MEPSETIPGGAYQDASGAWHDAEGKPLTKEQVSAFKALQAKRKAGTPVVADETPPTVVAPVVVDTTKTPKASKPDEFST